MKDILAKLKGATAVRLANLGKRQLLGTVSVLEDKELRWHVAQMLPRLKVTPNEQKVVLRILMAYLKDGSSIVKTFSMQALADLAMRDGAVAGATDATDRAAHPNWQAGHEEPRPQAAQEA